MIECLPNAASVVYGDERAWLFGCGQNERETRTNQILHILKLYFGEVVRNDDQPIGIPRPDRDKIHANARNCPDGSACERTGNKPDSATE
jgi:hypothetical protein